MKKIIALILIYSVMLAFLTGCSCIDMIIGNNATAGDETGNSGSTGDSDQHKNGHGHTGIVPEGYTGGFAETPCMHEVTGFYWLETYEEVLEAIELLKSHGSEIGRTIGFNCDGGLLDVKWCFVYSRSKAEPLEEGKNFFDRRIDGGKFDWYGFYDDVDMEKIYYDHINKYGYFHVCYSGDYDFENIESTDDLSITWWGKDEYDIVDQPLECGTYQILYQGRLWTEIDYSDYERPLPPDYFDEFLSTAVIVE